MASAREEQLELLAYLDGIMACINNYPMFNPQIPFLDDGVAVNVMSLLLQLLDKFYTEEEIIDFLVKILVYELPAIELAIKAVILSNLKLSISCNIDPWIPDIWRQHMYMPEQDKQGVETNPCLIPIPNIDYRNMFNINPVSEKGKQYYNTTGINYTYLEPYIDIVSQDTMTAGNSDASLTVGLTPQVETKYINNRDYSAVYQEAKLRFGERFQKNKIVSTGDIESIYELSHAVDMNAFLWFVLHKSLFLNANRTFLNAIPKNAVEIPTVPNFFEDYGNITDTEDNNAEIYRLGDIISTENNGFPSINYALCTKGGGKTIIDEKTGDYHYFSEIYPCSNRENSYIWYAPKIQWYTTNEKKEKVFDYEASLPLCNFSYVDSNGEYSLSASVKHNFLQVKILPAPMLHFSKAYWLLSDVKEGITIPSPFIKIRFNALGEPDNNGRFTVLPAMEANKIVKPDYSSNEKDIWEAEYTLFKNDGQTPSDFILKVHNQDIYEIKGLNDSNRAEFINDCLFPCYPGLTVYEFNYDFVMRTKLLDAKQTARRIFDNLTQFQIGLGASISMEETQYQMRIFQIVKEILESEDQELNDCFFSFSNDKFANMLHDAEVKRAHRYPFGDSLDSNVKISESDILENLDKFKDTATKQEQVDILTKTFSQGAGFLAQNILPEDRLNIRKDFIINALSVLGVVIFEALVSPKMLLLFEVNNRLMDTGEDEIRYPTLEELLKKFASLITSIISEIQKMIIEQIIGMIMPKIEELMLELAKMLTLEQITIYKELIMKLIKACSFSFPMFGKRANLDSNIDIVQYADIDPVEKPKTDNC